MLGDYRIVAFIPSGRQRVESILIDNLRRFPEIDEVQIWMNTDAGQVPDIDWLRQLPYQWDKVKLYEVEGDRLCSCWTQPGAYHSLGINEGHLHTPKQLNTGKFYVNTTDADTIYFRFDDDIVFIDDGYFANMVRFRIEHPEYFLVMGNIWNNATTSYLHQQAGRIDRGIGSLESGYCMDMLGWQSGSFAEHIHNLLLRHIKQGTTSELHFDHHDLDGKRFSISNFCFFGKDFADFGGILPMLDEEIWLTEVAGRPNVICGSGLVSHYSFFAQRDHLDRTDILERYRTIARQRLSESYYNLLAAS